MNDLLLEGRYKDAAGVPFDTLWFGTGEPNGGTAEKCVAYQDKLWADDDCALATPYLRDLRGPP